MGYRALLAQPFVNTSAITTAITSSNITNTEGNDSPLVLVQVATNPTGTTPSMTIVLLASLDGVNFFQIATSSAITASGVSSVSATNASYPYFQVTCNVTAGTYNNVTVNLYIS